MRTIRIVLALAAAGIVAWSMIHSARSATAEAAPAWRGRFPNVSLKTHDGRTVRFYDDLLRGRIVTLNFMYIECDGTCPGLTSTLVEVQRQLGDRAGRDILMISITLQPEVDTPERLRDYAARYGAGPGMVFLTGKAGDIEVLRRALGFSDEGSPATDGDRRRHLGILRIGNESRDWWTACPSLSGASRLCALLNSVDAPAVDGKPPLDHPDGPPAAPSLDLPDLRDFEALRASLERMHMARAGLEWSVYREQVLTRMAQYLRLGGEREAAWRAAMKKSLADCRAALDRVGAVRVNGGNVSEAWERYREEQSRAIEGLDAVLDGSPRHRVFRDQGPRWLFTLEGHPDHSEKRR